MAIPVYRYFTADMLTGNVFGELPLYGVYMDKAIKNAGNFTGTFRLGTGIEDDAALIESSYPQKTRLYCQRNGTFIWGGVIWSRTYESNAKTVQLSAQTFESYLPKVTIKANFSRTNVNQIQIMKDLFALLQSNPRSNLGIDTSFVDTTGGNIKSIDVAYYDYKYFGEAISELAEADDGFDWYINVGEGATIDHPILQLVVGQPNIVVGDTTNAIVYDYPGSIDQFFWPESGSKSGTDFTILGAGQGSEMLAATASWPGAEFYPEVDQIISRKDISNGASLASLAQGTANAFGAAITNPTIRLKADADPEFEGWNGLGSFFRFELESERFPTRKVLTKRLLGWELTPAQSGQSEVVALRIEGDDDA